MTFIGIDGGTKTGFAVWDTRLGFIEIETLDFWTTYERIVREYDPVNTVIVAEDPSKNKPVFSRGVKGRRALNIAQKVGGVKRESKVLIEGLRRAGFVVWPVRPQSSKWTVKTFRTITGWKGRTSEHGRDAAKLVAGRTALNERQFEQMETVTNR